MMSTTTTEIPDPSQRPKKRQTLHLMIWRWSVDLAADFAFDGRPIQRIPVATLAAITGADAPEGSIALKSGPDVRTGTAADRYAI